MAFGGFNTTGESRPMAEINMIPLIDVMLVLLVIFIITAPLLTHSVKIDLPRASSQPNTTRAETVQLAINRAGQLYWNGEAIDRDEMLRRMHAAGEHQPVPELHLRADRETRYEVVADVMASAARNGLTRIGFVSDPSLAH
jgi:biopolymer transport protein ExbD